MPPSNGECDGPPPYKFSNDTHRMSCDSGSDFETPSSNAIRTMKKTIISGSDSTEI